jgi:ribonucleoside-diphosphate reductase alpha chain
VNLWLRVPDLKTLSHMYRHAWHAGLKTTYYLRSLGASNIEKATVASKKEVRIGTGTSPSVIPAATITAAAAGSEPAPGAAATAKPAFTAEQKLACSIEAMRNGGECEACQ